ncbi:ATP-binding cassette [Lithospermum erythrorhizon]|uniref:ATP-binding cassette n=1 Tax=Lithospermum erythrorhizon TaxID=34254 RepID=A0AAV3QZX7_LITER
MFNGMSEMALTIFKLPVFFKQRNLLFYPSWAYALPTWILKIPISLVEAVVWIVLTYYEIALMGVSGAGKTTLMDVLAGRKTGGYTEGDIKISGYPKKQETFARISGYYEQNDIHSPHVTVYESLVYSAWLQLPSEVDYATSMLFVDEVMELTPLRGALVGLPGVNGLSTKQCKPLS